ncbi:MAG: hypothetical protein ABSG22_10430 [Sedimentisphaerales bacterium]
MGGMRKDEPLRFVIQRHTRDGERPHWDLMLEFGRILETYRVAERESFEGFKQDVILRMKSQ